MGPDGTGHDHERRHPHAPGARPHPFGGASASVGDVGGLSGGEVSVFSGCVVVGLGVVGVGVGVGVRVGDGLGIGTAIEIRTVVPTGTGMSSG